MLRLPSPIPFHDLLFIGIHTTVDSSAIFANLVLLLAILFRSPTSLRCFAVLLINSVLMDIMASAASLMIMIRLIPVQEMVIYVYTGPCASVSGFFCHCLFILSLATFAQSLFLNAISFAFRLYILDRPTPSPTRVLLICLLVYAATLAVLTPYLFALDDVNDIRRAIAVMKPNYDLDQYAIQGNLNIYEWKPMVAIAAIAVPSLPTLVGVVLLRAKVLAKISEQSGQMSSKTMRIHSTLAKVLTLQAFLPVLFFVGVVNFFLCQLSIVDCTPIQEHLMMQTVSFTPLIAPLITLYFVQPYREFVLQSFRCRVKRKISTWTSAYTVVSAIYTLAMHLPSPVPLHDLIFIIIHSTVDSAAIFANFVLLLAITFGSPTSLRCYAVLLVNTVVMDIVAAATSLMIMIRIIPVGEMVVYIYIGPCASVSGFFCHCLFIVTLSTFAQSLFLNAISFAFRLYILDRPTPLPSRVLVTCLLVYATTLAALTPYLFGLDDIREVRRAIAIAKPSYRLDEYEFQGNRSIFQWKPMAAIAGICLISVPTLVAVVTLRAKVLSKIREQSAQMSSKTMRIHSTLAKVLTLQAILPVLFLVGVVNFLLCQLNIVDSTPVQEHIMMQTVSFSPLIAPLITCYYVLPYRDFVLNIFRCGLRYKISTWANTPTE